MRAVLALALFLLMNAALTLLWPFMYYTRRDKAAVLRMCAFWTRWWLHQCTRLMGIRITATGPMPPPGSMIAPNHMGYADIFAIGAGVPCFFVAKTEVASWPVIGFVFRKSRQIAVTRARSTKTLKATLASIADRLRLGYSVCVFLEGTSSGGDEVLPFHGSLLQPALDAGAPLVPACVHWRSSDPAVDMAEDVAYWKDHRFFPHLFRLLGLRGVEAEVRFGEPIDCADVSRNELAARLHAAVVALHVAMKDDDQ